MVAQKMKFKTEWTVKDAVAVIAESENLGNADRYRLFLPPRMVSGDIQGMGEWLEMKNKFAVYPHLRHMDIVELKLAPHLLTFGMWVDLPNELNPWAVPPKYDQAEVTQAVPVQVDFQDSLKDIISGLFSILNLKRGEEYIFQRLSTKDGKNVQRTCLDVSKSFDEQDIIPGTQILLAPLSLFLKRPAETFKDCEKDGMLQKQSFKDGTATRVKKRWFALEDNLLYYYPSKTGSAPLGVIPLSYYSIGPVHSNQGEEDPAVGPYKTLHRAKSTSRAGKFGTTGSLSRVPKNVTQAMFGHSESTDDASRRYQFELHINAHLCFAPKNHRSYIISDDNEAQVREWAKVLHYKCANCSDKRLFEVSLEKAIKNQGSGSIPLIIIKAVDYISSKAMDIEGIFRKSGGMVAIQKYREAFDLGEDPDLEECSDPHAIAGLLKLYLRTLPEPLITFDHYPLFKKAIDLPTREEMVTEMRRLVNTLPKINQIVLNYLCDFLFKVAEHSSENLMTLSNIATVFGPNLLSPRVTSPLELMEHTAIICHVIEFMIEHQWEIFEDVRTQVESEPGNSVEQHPFTSGVISSSNRVLRSQRLPSFMTADSCPLLSSGRTGIQLVQTEIEALSIRLDKIQGDLQQEIAARERLSAIMDTIVV
eukprot:TRINITY_DN4016_c0_g1_i2.p1 TRINITY_DN4016_c0_g1~~TRINITY_DN4016_c0_g1_i2.p1  ORF type:complete len:647 (+),score=72.62 TRINITY_DN4016_c0_g1_i2:372-2312(+)